MFRNETKLTKYSLVIIGIILALYFATPSASAETHIDMDKSIIDESASVPAIARVCLASSFMFKEILQPDQSAEEANVFSLVMQDVELWAELISIIHSLDDPSLAYTLAQPVYEILKDRWAEHSIDYETLAATNLRCTELFFEWAVEYEERSDPT